MMKIYWIFTVAFGQLISEENVPEFTGTKVNIGDSTSNSVPDPVS